MTMCLDDAGATKHEEFRFTMNDGRKNCPRIIKRVITQEYEDPRTAGYNDPGFTKGSGTESTCELVWRHRQDASPKNLLSCTNDARQRSHEIVQIEERHISQLEKA